MKFETFKPGRWQQRLQYKSFEPVLVNHDWRWEDPQINVLLESANRALGELNAYSLIVPAVTVPHLVRLAISHYQFETIHPFLDGNGRIGPHWAALVAC